MNKKDQIANLCQSLENISGHPRMYFGEDSLPVVNFLWGFYSACHALGLTKRRNEIYEIVQKERGWKVNALHPADQMLRQGMPAEEIVREVLELELETWRRVYSEADGK
jgi:hypothetical protein